MALLWCDTAVITPLLQHSYDKTVMSFLGFSNNYFVKAMVTVQGSFTRDISWKAASVTWTWCTSEEVKMK